MSGDTEPVIQTVGSVDRHDQAELSDKIRGSVDKVPLGVLHDKLHDAKSKREETRDGASSPLTSSEPGVVGEIRTVGTADRSDGGAAASGRS